MKKIISSVILGSFMLTVGLLAMAADGKYVASKGSDKFHDPKCQYVQNIDQANLITFNSKAEAEKAGYKACAVCLGEAKKDKEAKFVASKGSNKYHDPSCAAVQRIDKANLISFSSKAEAEKAGYKPCSICLVEKSEKPKVEAPKVKETPKVEAPKVKEMPKAVPAKTKEAPKAKDTSSITK